MKSLLATLLCFVLMESPVFAIHGGYSLTGSQNLTGTYAGILVPASDTLLIPSSTDFGANSLGLFTLNVPLTGPSLGVVVVFSNGRTFGGSIQALPDPSTPAGLTGILRASFNYTLSGVDGAGNVFSTAVTAQAQGSFDAALVSNPASAGGQGLDLTGSSSVLVDQGFVSGSNGTPIATEQIQFAVEGYQQSKSFTTTATLTTGT